MSIPVLLPWQESQFTTLTDLHDKDRLGHAWILSGLEGIGKLQLAKYFANYLLCRQHVDNKPCGSCQDCHLFAVGTHPDWRLLQPPKKLIVVDQVRECMEFAYSTGQRSSNKVLVIDPAETMNLNAANALLKLLEEPPAGTVLLLISHQAGLLLPTLRSRCQVLRLPIPDTSKAIAWLEAQGIPDDASLLLEKTGGAPLLALALTESGLISEHETILASLEALLKGSTTPVKAAKQCEKISLGATIDFLIQCLYLMAKSIQTDSVQKDVELSALQGLLPDTQLPRRKIMALHKLHQIHSDTRKVASSNNNPNPLLILEQLFSDWSKLRRLS